MLNDQTTINRVIRLGTRGSLLARGQSQMIADQLQRLHPGLRIETKVCTTTGDRITDRPLHDMGGKGLFTKELEEALLNYDVDFVVHSFKDVPVTMPLVSQLNLIVAAVPVREDPRDCLASRVATNFLNLPKYSRVGTGSLRRKAQILHFRPDLRVELLRGNIDTRLNKMRSGEFDAVILAMAGLKRSGLFTVGETHPIDPSVLVPSAGQGALALQCRRDDQPACGLLSSLHNPLTAACVDLERRIVSFFDGDCTSPIGALATIESGSIRLRACIAASEGEPRLAIAASSGPINARKKVFNDVVRSLCDQGATELLHPETKTAVLAS
jgi:hydroxymethylbilane synthase